MAKFINDAVMDAALALVSVNANRIMIGTAQPATYADGNTYAVGTLATGTANFTTANGDGTGRKLTHSAATVVVGTTGTVNHVYLMGTAGSGTLFIVGTCALTSVTAAGTVVISAWDCDEISDPA